MSKIYSNLTELIGKTPLVQLQNFSKLRNLKKPVIAKLESFNPGGSVKDRIGLSMIEDAEKKGLLNKDSVIVEATSGNTGIGIAWVGASKGYKVILTMPETMSMERQNLLKALGVNLYLTPGKLGMSGAILKAEELKKEIPNAVLLHQFDNPANPEIHKRTTAKEIWEDTDGKVDAVIAGVGTGGTISGVSEGLKALNPDIEIIAVEPAESPVLSGGKPGPHMIQGIGAGFKPTNFYSDYIDKIVTVSNQDAIRSSRQAAASEGLLVGISSGASLHAATEYAKQSGNENKNIIAILPDTGERYLSTALYAFKDYPLE